MTAHTQDRIAFASAGAVRAPRFAKTYCSQCGGEFGPGNSGYSHCEDHRSLGAFSGEVLNAPNATYWDHPGAIAAEQQRCALDWIARNPDAEWPRSVSALIKSRAAASRANIRTAFSDLLVALADNHPVNIIGEADAADMEERAEHVQGLLTAVEVYLAVVLADAKHRTSGITLDVNVTGILSDTRGDIVGTFRIAAEQMRELEREFE